MDSDWKKSIDTKQHDVSKAKKFLYGAVSAAIAHKNQAALFRAIEDLAIASEELGRLRGHVQAQELAQQATH